MRQAGLIAAFAGVLALASPAAARAMDMVEAFKAACAAKSGDYEGGQAEATRLGWRPAEKTDTPDLARVIALAERALGPDLQGQMKIYAKDEGGKRYHLVLTLVSMRGTVASGCYLYDFQARQPLDRTPLDAWLGAPTSSAAEKEMVAAQWDQVASMPKVMGVNVLFVPADSPYAQSFFPGVALSMTSLVGQQSVASR